MNAAQQALPYVACAECGHPISFRPKGDSRIYCSLGCRREAARKRRIDARALRELVRNAGQYLDRLAGRMEFTKAWLSPEVDRALLFTGNAYIPLPDCSGPLTLDHVRDQPMMGKRAPSDMQHLVTLCAFHHLWSGWATSHRPELRAYLRGLTAFDDQFEEWQSYRELNS